MPDSSVAAPTPFIHLRAHSAYSLSEGALPVKQLAQLAVDNAMPALALTDSDNLFGALEFSEVLAGKGIQPIIGTTMRVELGDQAESPGQRATTPRRLPVLALLAKDEEGYTTLLTLTRRAWHVSAVTSDPHLPIALLEAHSAGLICLTGGPAGPVNQALIDGQGALARNRLARLADIFGGRLYVELQRHGLDSEAQAESSLIDLAYALDLPLVATNEPYFATRDDFTAHDALICIAEGEVIADENQRRLTPEHYFKPAPEMEALFADLPEAVANTAEIARRCAFRPLPRAPILPIYSSDEAEELRRQAREGLEARLQAHGPAPGHPVEAYGERLEFELNVIIEMKFPGYFLIVADFIKYAKAHNIPVGPGRGSGAGSLVAYALTITDLDPLRFNLLFERFLNPERVSMPDFDIDFCQDRRDEVIAYVQAKSGAAQVAQIITFGKLQARAVCRDVGRVLQMPYGQVDRLCKLIPMNPANPISLKQAIEGEPRLREERDRDET